MGLRIGDTAPDFEADSTQGRLRFHDWAGDCWAVSDHARWAADIEETQGIVPSRTERSELVTAGRRRRGDHRRQYRERALLDMLANGCPRPLSWIACQAVRSR